MSCSRTQHGGGRSRTPDISTPRGIYIKILTHFRVPYRYGIVGSRIDFIDAPMNHPSPTIWDDLHRDVVRSYTAKFMERLLRSGFNEIVLSLSWNLNNMVLPYANAFERCRRNGNKQCTPLRNSLIWVYTAQSCVSKKLGSSWYYYIKCIVYYLLHITIEGYYAHWNVKTDRSSEETLERASLKNVTNSLLKSMKQILQIQEKIISGCAYL